MSPTEHLAKRIEAVVRAAKALEETQSNYAIRRDIIREAEHALAEARALGEPASVEAGDD